MLKLKKILCKAIPLTICAAAISIANPIGFIRASYPDKFGTYIPASLNDIIVTVTAPTLNVRSGPGTDFSKIATVKKDDTLIVLGALDGWYVVHLPNNSVGVVSSRYVKAKDDAFNYMLAELTENIYADKEMVMDNDIAENVFNSTEKQQQYTTQNINSDTVTLSKNTEPKLTQLEFGKWSVQNFTKNNKADVDTLFSLINSEREKASAAPLKQENILTNIAYLKAVEMSKNQYFSHDSPTYGSPFEMLKYFGITYKRAAENIVGNNDIYLAHKQVMASPNHSVNVFNEKFKKVGIGISDDKRFGKIIVMMFVE